MHMHTDFWNMEPKVTLAKGNDLNDSRIHLEFNSDSHMVMKIEEAKAIMEQFRQALATAEETFK